MNRSSFELWLQTLRAYALSALTFALVGVMAALVPLTGAAQRIVLAIMFVGVVALARWAWWRPVPVEERTQVIVTVSYDEPLGYWQAGAAPAATAYFLAVVATATTPSVVTDFNCPPVASADSVFNPVLSNA